MNKTKKAIIGVGAALLALLTALTGFLLWRRATWRYPYSPETREVLSHKNSAGIMMYFPTLETNICLSDAVVQAKILDDGEVADERIIVTDYEIRVTEVLYGEFPEETAVLRLPGNKETAMAKPHRNDEVIIFVTRDDNKDCYYLTDMESSIFVVMPDETLYSFEDMESYTQYDGQSPERLREDMQEIMRELGGVMPEYLAEHSFLEAGAVFYELAEEVAQATDEPVSQPEEGEASSEEEQPPEEGPSEEEPSEVTSSEPEPSEEVSSPEEASTGAESSSEAEDGKSEPDGGEEPAE